MAICRVIHDKNNPYVMVNKSIVSDDRLSWKAKGMWLYAFSKPDNWKFYLNDLINRSTDGKESIKSGLKELEECGYLFRKSSRGDSGKFDGLEWVFYETSKTHEEAEREFKKCLPKAGFPAAGESGRRESPPLENPPLLINDCLPIKDKKNKEKKSTNPAASSCPSPAATDLSLLLYEIIKETYPGIKKPDMKKWANEIESFFTHRFELIDSPSPEVVKQVINFLNSGDRFWLTYIRSPSKLKDKFDQVYAQVIKAKRNPINQKMIEEKEKLALVDKNRKIAENFIKDHKRKFDRDNRIILNPFSADVKTQGGVNPLGFSEQGFESQLINAFKKTGLI